MVNLILASKSKVRKEILDKNNITSKVKPSNVDEDVIKESLLKENSNKSYTDLDKIKKEVEEAKKTFKKYEWPVIDVTRKSVEETAASVIKIYEIYKQNE